MHRSNPTDVAGRMLVFLVVAVLASLLGYSTPDLAQSVYQRVIFLFIIFAIYMLMPYLFMSLFVQDKRFYLQGALFVTYVVFSERLLLFRFIIATD